MAVMPGKIGVHEAGEIVESCRPWQEAKPITRVQPVPSRGGSCLCTQVVTATPGRFQNRKSSLPA